MASTEMLIEFVKKYPILYDLSHEDYKNIRKKDKLWDEIGQEIHTTDATRVETLTSNRQARFIGPLIGFFLASIFPNIAIAKLGHIKIQYDPIPLSPSTQAPIYQTSISSWEPITKPVQEFYLEAAEEPPFHQNIGNGEEYSEVVSTNIEGPPEYLIPSESPRNKVSVKRAISQRYLTAYRRNRYSTRRKFPEYFEYENYDYLTTPRLRNKKRNQGRKPIGFDDDYEYDYDYGKPQKKKNQRRRNKNKNRKDPDYYSDEDFDDDVEPVTVVLRPRQQQTTTPPTTTEITTRAPTTNITNGTTPSPTATTSNSTGYGYGPLTGNENVSITYGPPHGNKPVYGVPGTIAGTPLNEWSPNYLHESPSSYYSHHHTSQYSPSSYHSPNSLYPSPSISYHSPNSLSSHNLPSISYGTPSISYGSASASYGTPSSSSSSSYSPSATYGSPSATYGAPVSSYGAPSSSYGTPGSNYGTPSTSYGAPSTTYEAARPPSTSYGVPSQSYGSPSTQDRSYQSYQLPYSSWYGKGASQGDLVRRAQDVIRYA